jgi:hypothetical protein
MDQPVGDVKAALGKILACAEWTGTDKSASSLCPADRTGLTTRIDRDPADGTVQTIETGGALEWGDGRNPQQGPMSRRALHEVFDYLFPQWPRRSAWLDLALCNVMAGKRSTTKVGNLTILVQAELPADLPLIAAGVYVTKLSSVERWRDGRNGVAPSGRCAKRMPPNR